MSLPSRIFVLTALCFVALSGALCAPLLGATAAPESAASPPAPRLLKKIIITEGIEAAQALPADTTDRFVVLSPSVSFLDEADLLKRLQGGKDRPIDDRLLAAIAQVVESVVRQKDYAVGTAVIPPQSIADGTVRVAVLLGKVREIKVQGNRWFSEELLREKLRLENGAFVRVSELDSALGWTNMNPFRYVKIHIEPVPGTGEADLFVNVLDRFPLRLQATADNSGQEILGRERFNAGISYGNVWGADHRASYQFITSSKLKIFQGHTFEYQVPLAWRHGLQIAGSYMRATPTLYDGFVEQIGESYTANIKYVAPFNTKNWQAEMAADVGFKQTNNNLIFLGDPVPFTPTDVFTLTLGVTAVRPDRRGRWIVSTSVTGSPGNVNSRNTDVAYQDSRAAANSQFLHGQFVVQRLTQLTPKLLSISRGNAQLASTNLLATEQFSIGGQSTIRGYSDRIFSGDGGYMFSQELQQTGPTFSLGKSLPRLATYGVAFWDYGRVLVKRPFGPQLKSADIAGAGVGLKLAVGNAFSASLEYGTPVIEVPDEKGQLHVRVTLSY